MRYVVVFRTVSLIDRLKYVFTNRLDIFVDYWDDTETIDCGINFTREKKPSFKGMVREELDS